MICEQGTRNTSKAPHQSAYRKHMGLMSFVYSIFSFTLLSKISYLHQLYVHQEPSSLLDADLRSHAAGNYTHKLIRTNLIKIWEMEKLLLCDVFTNADLSDKTESATSLAVHVFLSFDVRNLEFGGPIWIKNRKRHNARERQQREEAGLRLMVKSANTRTYRNRNHEVVDEVNSLRDNPQTRISWTS